MKAKLGMLVTEASGSLGGHTFQNSKGGFQIRNKPIPRGNPSASQLSIRSINQQLQDGWHLLTSDQQKIWNDWPVTHGIFNAKGDKHSLSGHSLWMKYQFEYIKRGAPFLSDPSLMGPPYLGPELIPNGSFSTSSNWALNPESSIHDGELYLSSSTPGLYCYIWGAPYTAWTTYQLKMNCRNLSGIIWFGTGSGNWIPIYNDFPPTVWTTGYYTTLFYFYFASAPASAIIDNLSVKLIYP